VSLCLCGEKKNCHQDTKTPGNTKEKHLTSYYYQ
jgi:hypothetical protein